MNLVAEQKVDVKDIEFFILSPKNEDPEHAKTVENFIRYLNGN